MAEPWSVREARASGLAVIMQAWHAMRLEAGLPDDGLVPRWREALGSFLEAPMADHPACVWVAVQGGSVVATALALLKDDYPFCLFPPGLYAFIGCVYTAPGARRRGIATALCPEAVAWARARGARTVRLLPTAASASIYRRPGFREAGDLELSLR